MISTILPLIRFSLHAENYGFQFKKGPERPLHHDEMVAVRLTTQLRNTTNFSLTELLSIISESGRQDLLHGGIGSSIQNRKQHFPSALEFQFFHDRYFDLPDTAVAGDFDSYDVI